MLRDIENYEGFYRVSKQGDVFSCNRTIVYKNGATYTYKGKKIAKKYRNDGYVTVCLCKNGKQEDLFVHRLVASAFIGNPQGKLQVNHKDGDKSNNHISNLEWATCSENNKHAFSIGLKTSARGEFANGAKLKNSNVTVIKDLYSTELFSFSMLSYMFNVSVSTIYNIVKNKTYKQCYL